MQDIEDIEAELESKSIERTVDDIPAAERPPETVIEPEIKEAVAEVKPEVIKKSKKVRSEKQIAAFEKARKKRAELLAEKKLQKEAEKEQKKEEKKALKKAPPAVDTRDVDLIKPMTQGAPPVPHPMNPRHEVVNNYYYYNVEPDHHKTPKRKKSKSKRPPTPSSSESESSDEEEPVEHVPHQRQPQQYYEAPKPQYKFSYA